MIAAQTTPAQTAANAALFTQMPKQHIWALQVSRRKGARATVTTYYQIAHCQGAALTRLLDVLPDASDGEFVQITTSRIA